ncbi:MAG: DPP IV N-terminal domain-containing protein [Vulcanimicrobiaceae bacterium]
MIGRMLFLLGLLVACSGALLAPAATTLTAAAAFGKEPLWGRLPSRIAWAPDGRAFTYVMPGSDPAEPLDVRLYDVATGRSRELLPAVAFGQRGRTPGNVIWAPRGNALLYVQRGTLYVDDLLHRKIERIARGVVDPQWAPDGSSIAYAHAGDLYRASVAGRIRIERLTFGALANRIINGDLDWVYPEELGTAHGFAWSSDGRSIAYLHFDESAVTAFPIVDFLPYDNKVATERYPLAGEKNPGVSLRVINLATYRDRLVYDAARNDEYLPWFAWVPHTSDLTAQVMDRAQQHVRVLRWHAGAAQPTVVLEQHDADWVDVIEQPHWLPDGDSFWVLDRDGTAGLYLRDRKGHLTRLTGRYHVDSIAGVDARTNRAFIVANYPTRRDTSLLAVRPGGGMVDLTPRAGTHGISLSPGSSRFVDTYSTINDPPQVDLVDVRGDRIRATLAHRSAVLAAMLQPVKMLSVPSKYGNLDAWILKPPNFDPNKRYPAIVYVYGGPAAPTTMNGFGYRTALFHQLLAKHGFVVFSIDGPASQIDSDVHVRLLRENFGPGSLIGQEIGARYLASLPYVDASKIGIWGWSFGGYETTYALTHSRLFAAGVAVAPVTDWHLYDTIYTERYMGLPQQHAKAYDRSSVLNAVGNLRAPLLINHGTSDDNVHMANTISFLQRAIEAGRTNVDLMLYPRQLHGLASLPDTRYVFERMLSWWETHL